ncbi:MAG: hypothetical protein H7A51_19795 [Akkermansiaceae bacterium]|nr:hypothetical protein [Akkermansiaceae bacterium]
MTLFALLLTLMLSLIPACAGSGQAVQDVGERRNNGSFSGRVLYLGMYRDYDNGNHGDATTLGFQLNYSTPGWAGLDAHWGYNYAGTLFCDGNTGLLCNDDINVLNEAWLRYSFSSHAQGETQIFLGRRINHGEVFRADDYRQKARSLEGIQCTSLVVANTQLTLGHASRLSNWIDEGDRWDFNDFGDVFGMGYETDGVTWMEAVHTGVKNWEFAWFSAYAWDVARLLGARTRYQIGEDGSLTGYYRHESDLGKADSQRSDAYGLTYQQKVGAATLEAGYWAVDGQNLRFQELTTGINHALGSSMMIYAGQFNGGSQSVYLKTTASIGRTSLYALYNYTWQEQGGFDGQELNVVVKRAITENLSFTFKGGIGTRDRRDGADDTVATDGRVFISYTF